MEVENLTPEEDNASPEEISNPDVVVNAGEEEEVAEVESKGNWIDDLPADLKANPSIQKFKNKGDLAKSYVELQKLVGKDKVVVPNDKAPQAEWDAFWAKVGRPQDIKGYEAPNLEMPEDIKMPDNVLESFKAKAHELGLTKKQFAELYGLYSELNLNAYNQELEKAGGLAKTTETSLRQEWGAAYEPKVDAAQKVVNTFFKGKEVSPVFNVLANDKGFVKAMAEIADRLGEDAIAGGPRTTMTPQEATKEMNAVMGNPKHPYFDDLHPEHREAVDRMLELQRMASAGGV